MTSQKMDQEDQDSSYDLKFGKRIRRTGRAFSYTMWRTEIDGEIFWSVQGHNRDTGTVWIRTRHFGLAEEAKRYRQEVIVHHPTEKQIRMYYTSSCIEGHDTVRMAPIIVEHFKDTDNLLHFEFRVLRVKRRPFRKRDGDMACTVDIYKCDDEV